MASKANGDTFKSGGPHCCACLCSSMLVYFFGVNWLHNPDQFPTQIVGTVNPLKPDLPQLSFECYANPNAKEGEWNYAIRMKNGTTYSPVELPDFFVTNVTSDFTTWFGVGAILQAIALLAAFLAFIASCANKGNVRNWFTFVLGFV